MKFVVSGSTLGGGPQVELDGRRFNEIKTAKATCVFALDIEEKFALLLDNFYEFEVELLKLAEAKVIWPDRDLAESMRERLSLDRRLVNLLTACRLYLDQTDHGISGLFGDSSTELIRIKKFKNDLYDRNYGYRVMEALRNYVQHAGLPVHAIKYNWKRISDPEGDCFEHRIIPEMIIQSLEEDSNFNKTVLSELQSQGERADLRRPAREYISCLITLHDEIRGITDALIREKRKLYESAVAEFKAILFPNLLTLNDDDSVTERIALPTDFLEYSDAVRRKNQVNSGLQFSFASNRDHEK
jgi:hypothetical protein